MTTTTEVATEHQGAIQRLAQSAWSWDLWVSSALAAMVGVLWFTADFSIGLGWTILTTVASGCFILASWGLWYSVMSLITDTPYGELLHRVDPKEDEARAPFVVVVIVGVCSLVLSSVVSMAIGAQFGRLSTGLILIPAALMAAWGFLGSLHVAYHYRTHRRFAASVQESLDGIRAVQESAERHPAAESQTS